MILCWGHSFYCSKRTAQCHKVEYGKQVISSKLYDSLTNCRHCHRQHALLVGRRCHNLWKLIPEGFIKEDFLKKLRRVISSHTNVIIKKATCHEEPHKRYHPSADRRERHKHVALLASGTLAHKEICNACGLASQTSFGLHVQMLSNIVFAMLARPCIQVRP